MNTPNNKRRRESQQKMESAFMTLLENRELNQISVTDICKTAGINRTTFYANYTDIYALAQSVQKHLEEDVLSLYQEEWEQRRSEHNFLKLFRHMYENQLLYKTYFKLGDGSSRFMGYDPREAAAYYGNLNIEYHIEFFSAGLNAVLKKWLSGGCAESPEEIFAIIQSEYLKQLPSSPQ